MIQYVDSGNLATDYVSQYYQDNRQPYYYQTSTKNISFLKMVRTLQDLGIQNNKFFLILYDPDLMNVDPFDPLLSMELKAKVQYEVSRNLFYFLRECIRVPVPGAEIGSGIPFELHRGNLAISYLFQNNFNFYVELPRQNYKTWTILCCVLWAYNYATSNSQMLFMHQQHKYAKNNLSNMMQLRNVVPSYMRFKEYWDDDSDSFKKHQENAETVTNKKNNNKIVTFPQAKSEELADSIGRGMTQPLQFYDEFAFILFNEVIYMAASPAQREAARKAQMSGKTNLKVFASTPGDLATPHGAYAYKFINDSAKWIDRYYDWHPAHLSELIKKCNSGFFYIKYHYTQLGRNDEYFQEQCQALNWNMSKIKREVLLHWGKSSDAAVFTSDELDKVEENIMREPVKVIYLQKYYAFNIYEDIDFNVPIMIGVDVADGVGKDSSAIVAVNSVTGKEIGIFANSRITVPELTRCLIELCMKYIPNAVLNIERNRGKGIIDTLLEIPHMRSKLYWEHPQKATEEKITNEYIDAQGNRSLRVYGHLISTVTRPEMWDILIDCVRFYPDRFTSETIMTELAGLEIIKGRIDHGSTTHDDVLMAYMMAVYPLERGTNVIRFGLGKLPGKEDMLSKSNTKAKASTLLANANQEVLMDELGYGKVFEISAIKTYRDYEEEQRNEIERAEKELDRKLGINTSNDQMAGQRVTLGRDFFKDLNS